MNDTQNHNLYNTVPTRSSRFRRFKSYLTLFFGSVMRFVTRIVSLVPFLMSCGNNKDGTNPSAVVDALAAAEPPTAAQRGGPPPVDNVAANNDNAPSIPQLPAATGDDPNIPSIKLGETIRFEEWGPIILNTDGTTRRIANWDNLTEQEKKVTWRRISKRNEERRLVLLEQQKQQQQDSAEQNTSEL